MDSHHFLFSNCPVFGHASKHILRQWFLCKWFIEETLLGWEGIIRRVGAVLSRMKDGKCDKQIIPFLKNVPFHLWSLVSTVCHMAGGTSQHIKLRILSQRDYLDYPREPNAITRALRMKDGDSSRDWEGKLTTWEMALKTKTEEACSFYEAGRGLQDGSTVNTPLARRLSPSCVACVALSLSLWSSVKGNGKLIHQRGESAGKPNREHLWAWPHLALQRWNCLTRQGACSLRCSHCPCCFLVYAWIPRYFWLSAWCEENTEL